MIKMMLKQRYLLAAIISLTFAIGGCGGGGGGSSPTATGQGYVKARVSLQGTRAQAAYIAGRDAGRTSSQTSSVITVVITISGVYSETGEKFTPIVSTMKIDPDLGYGSASITAVPIGINHLLSAVATYPSGDTETVMVIIPQVAEAETTQAYADQYSTGVALVAIAYTEQNGGTLADIPVSTLTDLEDAVSYLISQGTPYNEITLAQVQDYIANGSQQETPVVETVVVAPETGTVAEITPDQTQPLVVTVTDSNNDVITPDAITWTVDPATLGTVDSSGVFTPAELGTGTVTATVDGVSGSVPVTVVAVCSTDLDCDDANALTLDSCASPDTLSAACVNTAIACNTDTDCASTAPVCLSGGTTSSACIACSVDLDCDDADSTTIDACTGGGTTSAVCSHTPISVDGTVTSGGVAVADAVVRLYDDAATFDQAVITDSTGYYYFTGVPSGTYYIVATKDGMTLESSTVTVP